MNPFFFKSNLLKKPKFFHSAAVLLLVPEIQKSATIQATLVAGTLGYLPMYNKHCIVYVKNTLTGRHFRFEHVHGYNVDEHNPAWTV